VVEWFGRPEIETDEIRERRISMEAVVDAYNEQERAIGWYYYLEGRLDFPSSPGVPPGDPPLH
jgi:hypothetical protein